MIYSTSNATKSIRKMVAENSRPVVYQQYRCYKPIRIVLNDVADIPATTCQAWTERADESLYNWHADQLLYYRPALKSDKFPECDALLFIECPQQYNDFEELAAKVRGDIIIYRPPSWKLHEETILLRYPTSDHYRALMALIEALKGRELTQRMQQALDYSGYDPERTAVFTAQDAKEILGMAEKQMRSILKYRFRGFYSRFEVYRPMCAPVYRSQDEMYAILENEPDLGGGWRMLRFNELRDGRAPEFKRYLREFVRSRNVQQSPSIYLLTDGYRKPNFDVIDAVTNARRGNWFKMRNVVDGAPEYLTEGVCDEPC